MAPASGSCSCPYCSSIFSRPDAASRHAKRCPKRDGRSLSRRTGRRLKSCNECARSKMHCVLRFPELSPICERCQARKLDCNFVRHTASNAGDGVQPDQSDRGLLEFFLKSTDHEKDFVVEKAVAEEPDGEVPNSTNLGMSAFGPATDTLFDFIDPSVFLSLDLDHGSGDAAIETSDTGLVLSDSTNDLLATRINALELDIAARVSIPFERTVFRDFFTPIRVRSFAESFCRKRHYHYQLIHWPTFALEEISLPLLLVVALTGAAYTFHSMYAGDAAAEARNFYALADTYVFAHLEACSAQSGKLELADSIQICQAALLMYALDTLPASIQGMLEVAVTRRLPALINALRKLGFIGCRHEPFEDEKIFLQREQIIRLVAWTFCADSLATLSYNKPPSFSLLEMEGDLPCEPAMWEADLNSARQLSKQQSTPESSLKDLMSKLLNAGLAGSESFSLFHVHIMLCAFQQVVFNTHVSMVHQPGVLLQALKTWRQLWQSALSRLSEEERSLLGVAKYVSNLEYLTRRIVEVSSSRDAASTSQYLRRIPSCDARDLHMFIKEYVLPR